MATPSLAFRVGTGGPAAKVASGHDSSAPACCGPHGGVGIHVHSGGTVTDNGVAYNGGFSLISGIDHSTSGTTAAGQA